MTLPIWPGAAQRLLFFVLAHTAQYALWLASWWVIGSAVLDGRVDSGTLTTWALLLAALVPFRLLAEWLEGRIAIEGGGLLKRRLLLGALRLRPDELRHQGAGQLLGRVLEAEAIETLAVTGGLLTIVAAVEAVIAIPVLAAGAAPLAHTLLLGAWLAATVVLARRHLGRQERWSADRLELTHELVEHMIGHRTRLAQQPPEDRHTGEDVALAGYLDRARAMDSSLTLIALIARGWLLTALLALVATEASTEALAVSLGGILLGFRALSVLAAGVSQLAGAAIAWRQIAPLVRAAARPQPAVSEARSGPLLAATGLHYQHPGRKLPTLRDCDLVVHTRERLVLEGPSGSGKSTLAALIAGLRPLQQGSLERCGQIVAAPQFHENHIFLAPLAFNLLLGRDWPPGPGDLERAYTVCCELGLGPVIDRMPAGLQQIVGETGWQLSHGERSLIFIARTLLADPQLIVLDESLAALDPATHRTALSRVLAQDAAVLLITH